ncbi:hypothetical protein FH972_022519 [Carpinus fangiana]|uniref:Fork-head domain-containing protein n=1 Tax=Carpinus fangiana TaxID=176857 RepID=A0A5N6KST5_9ROSI|nr:hypothetical protein FH972_022519 [Carpinus fangiana]
MFTTSSLPPAQTLPYLDTAAGWPQTGHSMNSDDYDVSSDDGSSSHLHTIAPSALQYGEEYMEDAMMMDEEESGYAALEFPDTIYFVKETSLVLGRDTKLQDWLNNHIESRRNDKLEGGDLQIDGSIASDVLNGDDRKPRSRRRQSPPAGTELGTVEGGIGRAQYRDGGIQELENGDAFLPIHTPMNEETGDVPDIGAISKQHLRLRLDEHAGWSMQVLGRNGCVINDDYYHQHDEVELQDGDNICIAGLSFYFRLPEMFDSDDDDVDIMDGIEAEGVDVDGFHNGSQARPKKKKKLNRSTSNAIESSDEEEAKVTKKVPKLVLKHGGSKEQIVDHTPSETPAAGDATGNDDDSPQKVIKKSKYPMDPNELLRKGEVLPQKRGPGRPPKNGMMSKREMKERLKMMEDERRKQNGEEAMPKSGKSGSKPKMENGDGEKKAKKRRRSTEGDDSKKSKGDGKDGPTPGPRTPSPKIEDYTPQELEKPSATYAELLYPLLQETGPLSLQEIYRHFEKKWPYYKFGCKGTGWQSSIRHTVNTNVEKGEGHFVKDSKDGKGFKWAANKNNPVPIKPSRVNNANQTPVYHGAPPNHGHPPLPHAAYGGPHNPAYQPRPYNAYSMHPPGPYPQQPMRPPPQGMQNGPHYPPRPAGPPTSQGQQPFSSPYRPDGAPPRQPSGPAPQSQQQPPPPNSNPVQQQRPPYPPPASQPYPQSSQAPPQQSAPGQASSPQASQQAGQQPPRPPYQPPPQPQSRPAGPPNAAAGSQTPVQQGGGKAQAFNGTAAPNTAQQAQGTGRPMGSAPVHNGTGTPTAGGQISHATPISRPSSTQTTPAQTGPPRRAPEASMSGLECLLRGIRPPVFDEFKKVFLEEQPGRQAETRERAERQLGQAIDWFMRNRTIDKDHESEPDEIKALIKTLKQLLMNQHQALITQRQRRQQGIANGATNSRSSTPVNGGATPSTGATVAQRHGQVQSPYAAAARTSTPGAAKTEASQTQAPPAATTGVPAAATPNTTTTAAPPAPANGS